MNRKANASFDYTDAVLDARDASVYLPSDKARPSPLLRQNFDQSWQRWQAKKAEERALVEMDRIQLELDQQRLFGEDVGDDALYRMGIFYNDDEDITQDSQPNTVSCDVPVQQSIPLFIIRHGKPKRSRRCSTWRSIPLYLSFSELSDDAAVARLLSQSPSTSPTPTIQHRTKTPFTTLNTDISIPQSLPAPSATASASAFGSGSLHGSHFLNNPNTISIPLPIRPSFAPNTNTGDWTFIQTSPYASHPTTPSSEPETWILIDDS
ncbi:hypothetical protein EG329_002113 [Mollisiaceae sp. DMI_Dod_QoI]|nr:hypothetical protein EG329_002113 [Helotiales sp. DMI_Dod_QoI]